MHNSEEIQQPTEVVPSKDYLFKIQKHYNKKKQMNVRSRNTLCHKQNIHDIDPTQRHNSSCEKLFFYILLCRLLHQCINKANEKYKSF